MMEQLYKHLCNKKSDINEHLPTLRRYSEECDIVTEFGVRRGTSTCALLLGKPERMVCFDIDKKGGLPLEKYKKFAERNNIEFSFNLNNVLSIEIDETDLLFIDTFHTYTQLSKELYLHSGKVKKYIILHDTETFGSVGEDKQTPGLSRAISEFLKNNTKWSIVKKYKNNNGLTILGKG